LKRPLPWSEPWTLARLLAEPFGREGLVLLEGDGTALGSRAVLGVAPIDTVVCRGLPGDGGAVDPFAALAALQASGGPWLGWLSYEAGAWVEPSAHWQRPDMAILWAARHDPLIHFDRQRRQCWLQGDDRGRLLAMEEQVHVLMAAAQPDPGIGPHWEGLAADRWHWHTSGPTYEKQVVALRDRIASGDLFQANLTACCEAELDTPPDPLALYGRLRHHCPAPFAGLAVAGQEAVVSASPERFLQLDPSGHIQTRPIKGTRPRQGDPGEDARAAAELVCAPKDRAENVMIVDLMRNDLGRVCQPGSIAVPQLLGLESYARVHHLTSVVEGQLRPECDLVDLLRACWPGGSITGAPKVRACRRLHELEPVPRGPYCGSLFWLAPDGRFDSSILIRSLMVRDRRLRLHAGGGIVADSDPGDEAQEMGWKLLPLVEALA
jgi:para-aminobenzoate synthetase component 1